MDAVNLPEILSTVIYTFIGFGLLVACWMVIEWITPISLRKEIEDVKTGKADAENNLLKNAPHTHHLLLEGNWSRPYSKEEAYFPLPVLREDKFWPPVGRVDNVYGDRNLVCTCPPMEDYLEAAE